MAGKNTAVNFFIFMAISRLFLESFVYADSNKDRSYINIENPIPCIRRFNATHQIGCAKLDIDAYEGIVYVVRNSSEFIRLKTLDLKKQKLIAVTIPRFYPDVVNYYLKKREDSNVNGIVLIATENKQFLDQTKLESFSDDKKQPNLEFGLYANNRDLHEIEWNEVNTNNYMFENFEIPVYVITEDSEAKKIVNNCYEEFNQKIFEESDGSTLSIKSTDLVCGMELGLDMSGAISSKVCIRRENIQYTVDANQFCDPLGGDTYFTFLSQKPSNSLPITLVASRIDTYTLYEYYTPAANEPITSIIGLLAVADVLAKNRDEMTEDNVVFVLFDNEAFDYGGSLRFVNDLINDQFPSITVTNNNTKDGTSSFKLDKVNIKTMIELNQLGSIGLSANEDLFIHRDPLSYSNPSIARIIDELTLNLTTFSSNSIKPVSQSNQGLPPSSIQSFLKLNLSVAGLLITDHEKNYKNKYFHSIFDTSENINVTFPENITESEAANYNTDLSRKLQKMMTNIAKTIYFQASKKELNDQVNQTTLNRLVYCFYKNTTCDFFRSILTDTQWNVYDSLLKSNLPKYKLSFYTSVNNAQISGKWISQMLLKYFTRNQNYETLNVSECDKNSEKFQKLMVSNNLTTTNVNYVNGVCIGTSLYAVSSVSPAFNKYLDGKLVDVDRFPAWTESSWNGKPVQMRLFMYTNQAVQISSIVIGVATLILSFGITIVANRLSDKWFKIDQPEQIAEIIES